MKTRTKRFKEDLQLDLINQQELELAQKEAEQAAARKKLQKDREEQARTIPPCEEVQLRAAIRRHEERASRGEVANQLRTQNRSLILLFLLAAATLTLVWWGLQLMQGP